MPPRKRAAKKAVKKAAEAPVVESPVEDEWPYPWPKAVAEKHRQRQEEARQLAALRTEQKKQRLINGGVPPEKHSI